MKDKPVIIVPRILDGVSPEKFVEQKLATMSEKDKAAFYNLSYVKFPKHWNPAERPLEHALAIINTNGVAAGDGDGVGVFPTMARLNHGCSGAFNAVYSWRPTTGEIVVYALKDISRGQVRGRH